MALTKAQQNVVERIDRQISSLEKRGWTYTQVDLADLRELINMAAILNVTEPMKLRDDELSTLRYWTKNRGGAGINSFLNQAGVITLMSMIRNLAGPQIDAYNKAKDDAEALLKAEEQKKAAEEEKRKVEENRKEFRALRLKAIESRVRGDSFLGSAEILRSDLRFLLNELKETKKGETTKPEPTETGTVEMRAGSGIAPLFKKEYFYDTTPFRVTDTRRFVTDPTKSNGCK